MNPRIFLPLSLLVSLSAAGAVVTYSAPEEEALSMEYRVTAGGQVVDVYTARVLDPPFAGKHYDYGGPYSFANFDVDGPVEVRITSTRPLKDAVVRPAFAGVRTRLETDGTLVLWFPGPRKVSVEPDGRKGPLLLFANPMEGEAPRPDAPGMIYYGPGVHDAGRIQLGTGQTLYLAGGAVVKGGVVAEGENIRIAGRGILDSSDYEWRKGPTPHVVSIVGTNVHISGITIRGASHWTIVPRHSRHITVRGVKLCGSRVQNDDGINPCNSQDVLITDCFIRTDDDCVALKGLDLSGTENNVERVTVENCVLWCDRARIFLLGHESRAPFMRDITLRNLDIIHFSMTPFLFEPGEEMRLQNVVIDNVRLNGEAQRELARLKPVVNQYMRNKVPGHIHGIRFSQITVTGAPGPYQVQLSGADEMHFVSAVTFVGFSILGKNLTADSKHFDRGPHVSDVNFGSAVVPLLREQEIDGEFPGWKSFLEKDEVNTRDVWQLNADGVLHCNGTPRGYLHTESEYGDFILEGEWRYPAGSTNHKGGLLARLVGDHRIWPKSLEFQLNQGQAGDFWALKDYRVSGPEGRLEIIADSPYGVLRHLTRFDAQEKPSGEWNRFRFVCKGGNAISYLNGTKVNEATGCLPRTGKIGLTAEGQEIEMRNLTLVTIREEDRGP